MSAQQYVRAFIAIELPPPLRRSLWEVERSLQSRPSRSIKWVPEDNLHLTLKFLGDVPLSLMKNVVTVMEEIAGSTRPLRLGITGLGAFPSQTRPRVLWAGLGGDIRPLAALANETDAALVKLGFPRETRPFTPHLTLARVRPEAPAEETRSISDAMASFPLPTGMEFVADGMSLMKSVLRPEGASYSRLASASLRT